MRHRELRFIYTVVRTNGWTFSSSPFTLQEIELGEATVWLRSNFVRDSECHTRQFTGMKDKNKQECYEGDIVKIRDEQLRKIVYYENGFEMRLLNDKRDSTSTTWYYDFEIIGNIYHNPELLK